MAERNKIATKAVDDKDAPTSVVFKFANGVVLNATGISLDPKFDELGITGRRLFLHGLAQKIGDEYANSEGNVDNAVDWAQAMYERLQSGEWSEARQGGGGVMPSLVVEAVERTLEERGVVVDEATKVKLTAKYSGKDSKPARDKALTDDMVNKHYEAIKSERAAARALKAKEKADAGKTTLSTDDLAA